MKERSVTHLRQSAALGRVIRQDPPSTLGVSTWRLIREAIQADKNTEALELLEYARSVDKTLLEALFSYRSELVGYVRESLGEQPAEDIRARFVPSLNEFLAKTPGVDLRLTTDTTSDAAAGGWDQVRQAIVEDDKARAVDLLDRACLIDRTLLDGLISHLDDLIAFMATNLGEEAAFKLIKRRYFPRVKDFLARTPGTLEAMQREVENQRGHHAELEVVEEEDRYVVHLDPCGTGGRLRRNKAVARTKEAHPWSWGKTDMPYYCSHCTLMWEIIPIEERGYPISVFLPPKADGDKCVHLYYKRPELIPEEYFTRVGKTKPKQFDTVAGEDKAQSEKPPE
jgi:hypothetical protein